MNCLVSASNVACPLVWMLVRVGKQVCMFDMFDCLLACLIDCASALRLRACVCLPVRYSFACAYMFGFCFQCGLSTYLDACPCGLACLSVWCVWLSSGLFDWWLCLCASCMSAR